MELEKIIYQKICSTIQFDRREETNG